VLYDTKDHLYVAALMDAIVSHVGLRAAIVASQTQAVERLRRKDFAGTLLGLVDKILRSPRASAPSVAYDFWHQFDAAETLEALRQLRPSVYKALPPHP
jgi:hypothetical protein